MIGLPNFSTREDAENALKMFPYSARVKLLSMYNDRYTWVKIGDLLLAEDGIQDENHIVSKEQDGGYVQLEKVVDTNAAIYRLGFTDEELRVLLDHIETYHD